MRAQVSMEYLILMGFTLLLLTPLLILYSNQNVQIQESFSTAQATRAGETLSAAAERVYYAGPPSQERVLVRIPENIDQFLITTTSIEFILTNPPGRQINTFPDVPLIENTSFNTQPGSQYFIVRAETSGVRIIES